jgi:hypothetical protein
MSIVERWEEFSPQEIADAVCLAIAGGDPVTYGQLLASLAPVAVPFPAYRLDRFTANAGKRQIVHIRGLRVTIDVVVTCKPETQLSPK